MKVTNLVLNRAIAPNGGHILRHFAGFNGLIRTLEMWFNAWRSQGSIGGRREGEGMMLSGHVTTRNSRNVIGARLFKAGQFDELNSLQQVYFEAEHVHN